MSVRTPFHSLHFFRRSYTSLGVIWFGGGSGAVSSGSGVVDVTTITCIAPGSFIGNVQKAWS